MYQSIRIADQVFWVGTNDRRTTLFENIWPIENGVSYNAYVIMDEKIALIDTVDSSKIEDYIERLKEVVGDRKPDYLIINHMEPDHSGAVTSILREYPEIQIVGNKLTSNLLNEYFRLKDNILIIKEGDTLPLGNLNLKFFMTPWLHWPETMMTYLIEKEILFSGDAFGSFGTLDGGIFDDEVDHVYFEEEMLRYYSNIVGKYSENTQDALKKLSNIPISTIAATHGPVWRTEVSRVIGYYNDWSSYKGKKGAVVIYGTMYGNTAKMAEVIGRRLASQGIKDVKVYDASKTHASYLIKEVWKYKGVILGTAAYNAWMFPPVENITIKLEQSGLKNRLLGIFGTSSWNRTGIKALNVFANKIGWELVSPPFDIKGSPENKDYEECIKLADGMAKKLHSIDY